MYSLMYFKSPVDAVTTTMVYVYFCCCFSSWLLSLLGLGSQMGRFVRAQLWGCTAERLQIRLFSAQEHYDTVPVRFPTVFIQIFYKWYNLVSSIVNHSCS